MLVPGGFGDRGVEGMILATNYARTHQALICVLAWFVSARTGL